jgi:hypothetical protein
VGSSIFFSIFFSLGSIGRNKQKSLHAGVSKSTVHTVKGKPSFRGHAAPSHGQEADDNRWIKVTHQVLVCYIINVDCLRNYTFMIV